MTSIGLEKCFLVILLEIGSYTIGKLNDIWLPNQAFLTFSRDLIDSLMKFNNKKKFKKKNQNSDIISLHPFLLTFIPPLLVHYPLPPMWI